MRRTIDQSSDSTISEQIPSIFRSRDVRFTVQRNLDVSVSATRENVRTSEMRKC